MTGSVDRWSIVILDLDPALGHEQQGIRRALVVSYGAFHRSGLATICPMTSRAARYPGEVAIPAGTAGQTLDGVVLVHRLRTVDLRRVTASEIAGQRQVLSDPAIRRAVRSALAHHLGLDLPASLDGAASIGSDRRVSIRPATRPFAAVRAQRVRPLHLSVDPASILDEERDDRPLG